MASGNRPPSPSPRQPLGLEAYDQIYRRIMTLASAPGLRLEEKRLMKELGIGRTPIREALVRLSAEFMLETQPSKGFVVRPVTLQNTKAAFAALKILESGVADIAVRQEVCEILPKMVEANARVKEGVAHSDILALVESNSEFHQLFARCSRNEYLINALYKVRCEIDRLAYLSFSNEIDPFRSLADHYRSVVKEHETIIECLKKHDDVKLKETLHVHTQAFQKRIILYMAS